MNRRVSERNDYYTLKIYIIYTFTHKYLEIQRNYVKNTYSIYSIFDFATMLIIIIDLAKNCYKYCYKYQGYTI